MNDKTKIMYNLARMHEYTSDVIEICERYEFDYEHIIEDMVSKHAVNMCIVQLGEHASRIRDLDRNLYEDENLHLFQIKGMRDRIAHSYGDIDYKIVKQVLKEGIPQLQNSIEALVETEVIRNPYALFEQEYDDYIRLKDINVEPDAAMKECMKRTVERRPKSILDKNQER